MTVLDRTQPTAGTWLPDAERLAALRRMKRLATGLLLLAAVVFAVAFALQDRFAWLGYVRAAAEGAMVGAIADWFAVTALFRHPLGLKIPHTAIIPTRKDEIGRTLGAFVELEFLSDDVVLGKLRSMGVARRLGEWLREPANADRLTDEAAVAGRAALTLLGDEDVEEVIERLARRHLFAPDWGPTIGRLGSELVAAGQHRHAVDAFVEQAEVWLESNPEVLGRIVAGRLPKWLPGFVDRFVDDRAHREALGFVRAVRDDPEHPVRLALDQYLRELTDRLQHDPAMIQRVEALKLDLLESPRVREFAAEAWASLKATLDDALGDPASALRTGLSQAVVELGARLADDPALQAKADAWMTDAAAYLVRTYRHDIAGVISETVERWDPREATEKIEVQVGRDLQFIRINGTVVGALAGLAIYSVATGLHALVG
ncbi:DUF445 domain-containing protein [Agromyces aerolatus]|uniref:DUF445 domain-containing protein n=1 Tax=Agromyces sp. LY-1074 TaxID=3074080 RepID=UPI00286496AF|nr:MULTISPECIES: DUF445 domain-containing protein [unclassified Agromyces]MDR5700496.1 DUF445 domain-containing protein [Agromyces sp. LY-1074]MDR5707017.1 DUF445 domain-containing protein [Agromyces sp. LY-1358]